MQPTPTTPPRKGWFATAWSVISYVASVVFIVGIILVPAYMSGWRFGPWFREVLSILWPLPALFSAFAIIIAHDSRKRHDSDDAYRWMFRAVISALLSLFMLWLTVRHRL